MRNRTAQQPTKAEMVRRRKLGIKWCYGCRAFHSIRHFGNNATRSDGLQNACCVAMNAARRQR